MRIASYRAVMTSCATVRNVERVLTSLDDEENNQVGSYVRSHLLNTLQSRHDVIPELRNFLQRNEARFDKEKFDLNPVTFSRNYDEDAMLLPGSVHLHHDSDVIFSPQSFVPRSVRSNVSVSVFGARSNLLQLQARAEGVESLLEDVFGKKEDGPEQHANALPFDIGNNFENYLPKEPELQLSVTLLGNNVVMFDQRDLTRDRFKVEQLLSLLASGQELKQRRSVQMIDSEMQIATVSGLTVRMSLEATASVDSTLAADLQPSRESAAIRNRVVSGTGKAYPRCSP